MRYTLYIIFAAAIVFCACSGSHEHHSHDGHNEGVHAEADEHNYTHVHQHEEEEGVIHFSQSQAKAAGLKLETIQPADFVAAVRVSGQVTAAQGDEAAVIAGQSGTITFLRDHLAEGTAVNRGDALARVAGGALAGGDETTARTIELEAARQAYERALKLSVDSIVSAKELQRLKTEYAKLRASIGVNGTSGSVVTSPMTGFIKNVLVRQGEYVTLGQTIATVTKNCDLQLRAEVPERHFASMGKIRTANFEMSYEKGVRSLDSLHGHLVSVGKVASDGASYIPVTFEFENHGDIVPGAFADIWLCFEPEPNVLSVPITALTEEQGVFFVYVRHDEDEYEKREVKTGRSNGLRTEIVGGLKAGERVVVCGVYQVKLAATATMPEAHNHNH